MAIRSSMSIMVGTGAVLAAATMLESGAGPGHLEVLYSFQGNPDAEYPSTDLAIDAEGNLYGMTVLGGTYGSGTVFQLSPTEGGRWAETVLYSFTSQADGGQPYGGVTLDDQGNIYGTAVVGGTGGTCVEDGCGVVWKLTNTEGRWTQSVIYNFTGLEDGYGAGGPVVFDRKGSLYGMTPTGGKFGLGTIYQLEPDGNGNWTFHLVHAFTGGLDGSSGSAGRLLIDDNGNILGVATVGGAHGLGTIFRISQADDGQWHLKTLYSFKGEPDGVFPYGGLVRDASGSLYGTTYYGGLHGDGTVFKLAYTFGGWRESVLYSFKGEHDGAYPISHLVMDDQGNMYGTTSEDGSEGCSCGTLFKVSRSPFGSQRWTVTTIHAFEGSPDGAYSYGGLVADSTGTLYGATVHGGADDDGTVYRYSP